MSLAHRARRASLATFVLLSFGSSAALAQTVVETFTGTSTYDFSVPGTTAGGGVDFSFVETFTSISFTPGAVSFDGQPVDFSGTEADFLASSHAGSAHFPVTGGPAVVTVTGDGNFSGPGLTAAASTLLVDLDLGAGFSPSNLDALVSFPYDSRDHVLNWSSSAVPELNGRRVSIQRSATVSAVDAVNGLVDVTFTGQVVVLPQPIPTLPQWGLIVLAAGLLGLGLHRARRARPADAAAAG